MNKKSHKNNFDELVDTLLSAASSAPRAGFTERVLNATRESAQEDSRLDSIADSFLKRSLEFPSITDAVMSKIRSSKRAMYKTITRMSIVATLSACAAVAVMVSATNSTSKKWIIEESTFAKMSNLDDEISKISLLVMQEEMLDFISYRNK